MGTSIFFNQNRAGQTIMEFTAMFMIIVGALVAVQVYFKRGIQGRWKTAMEEMSEELYDPRFTDSNVIYRTASNAVVEITTIIDGTTMWTMRTDHTNAIDTRTGRTLIGGYELP